MDKRDHILQQLATIISPEHIHQWDAIASPLQDQIAQAIAPTHTPTSLVYPQTQAELAEIVTCARHHGWTLLPCGNGSKLHWGGLANPIDVVVSTRYLTQVIEHAVGDLTITVEPGITFAKLQAFLAPHKQWLALDPSYAQDATLGGILATADAGFFRQRYGGARDQLIGISFIRSDGQRAKAGGRVVKNVAGYDLMKLLTGSWGTLGIISEVTLRVYPQQPASKTVYLTGSGTAIESVRSSLFASSLTPVAAAVLSPATSSDLGLAPQLTLVARFQSIPISIEQQTAQVMAWGDQNGLSATVLEHEAEADLWQKLTLEAHSYNSTGMVAKVGVMPSAVIPVLEKLHHVYPTLRGWINTGNGIGSVQIDAHDLSMDSVDTMRSLFTSNEGYLTVLSAPVLWKQSLDLWGYTGNAFPIMKRLKQQFDPSGSLSPGRFLGDI